MARTFNRTPFTINTPNSSDIKDYYFTHSNWKGLNNNKNFLIVDQETFEDCNNVYVNSEGVLKSRPSIKSVKIVVNLPNGKQELSDIINVWNFGDIKVYETLNNVLTFVNPKFTEALQIELHSEKFKLVLVEGKIFIFASTEFLYYDTNSEVQEVLSAESFVYVPTKVIDANGQTENLQYENELTSSYAIEYLYTSASSIALDKLVGKEVIVTIDGNEYRILFEQNKEVTFVNKYTTLTEDQLSDENCIGPANDEYPLMTVTKKGITVICSKAYVGDALSYDVYVSATGLIYYRLPSVNDATGLPHVTEDELYVIIFSTSGPKYLKLFDESGNLNVNGTWSDLLSMYKNDSGVTPIVNIINGTANGHFKTLENFSIVYRGTTQDIGKVQISGYDNSDFTYTEPYITITSDAGVLKWCSISTGTYDLYTLESQTQPAGTSSSVSSDDAYRTTTINLNPSNSYFTYKAPNDYRIFYEIEDINLFMQTNILSKGIYGGKLSFNYRIRKYDGQYTVLIDTPLNLSFSINCSNLNYGDELTFTLNLIGFTFTISGTCNNTYPVKSLNNVKLSVSYLYDKLIVKRNSKYDGLDICTNSLPLIRYNNGDSYVKFSTKYISYLIPVTKYSNYIVRLLKGTVAAYPTKLNDNVDDLSKLNGIYDDIFIDNVSSHIYVTNVSNKLINEVTDVLTSINTLNFNSNFARFSDSGYLLTDSGVYDAGYSNMTMQLLFKAIPIKFYDNGLRKYNFYLYKNLDVYTSNITSPIVLKEIIQGKRNYIVPDYISQLDSIYFGQNNKLYISSSTGNDFKWYFPKINTENFDYDITNLHPISKDELAIFFKDNIYYVSKVYDESKSLYSYSYYKSKMQIGCKKGNSVITSYDNKYILFSSSRGLVAMSYQDFVASTEQVLTYLSDSIYDTYMKFNKEPIKLLEYGFWVICYKQNCKDVLVLDTRNNSWWPVNSNYVINFIKNINDDINIICNNGLFKLDDSNFNYYDYDGVNKNPIRWSIKSQKLYLSNPNNLKHISNITVTSVSNSDNEDVSLDLIVTNYRTRVHTPDVESFRYKVNKIRTFVKKLHYSKVNEFQYLLTSDESTLDKLTDSMQVPIKLSNISIKYKISGQVR